MLSDTLGCGDTTIRQTINVIDAPDMPLFSIDTDTAGCPGDQLLYTATDPNQTYTWELVSGDATINDNGNTCVNNL